MSKAREVAEIISYTDAINTSSIEESGNLYFTNQRGIDSGSATYILQADQQSILNSASATADANSNLYSDIKNLESIITASAAAVAYADGLTTTDVAENTNLYFTNERAVNAGSATYILQTSQQGIINSASAAAVTALLDSAPGALDTLNELSAALNDDPNFYSTIQAVYLTQSNASATYATIENINNLDALPSQVGNVDKYLTTDGTNSSWATLNIPDSNLSINAQVDSYTLVLSDADKLVELNVGGANNLTVPLNSSVAYSLGTQINILQTGAAQTTIVATGGVTINATPGLKLRAQWSSATLIKRATDTWVAIGDLVA